MKTVEQFIKDHGLIAKIEPTATNPHMDKPETMDHWQITIYKADQQEGNRFKGQNRDDWGRPVPFFTFTYSTGFGHRIAKRPEAYLARKKGRPIEQRIAKECGGFENRDFFQPNPPKFTDALDCVASECSGYDNQPQFEDWAADYGYDPDSRKAERAFETIGKQCRDLERFLGPEAYNELLYKTARL